ncbi:hypothetical protein GLW08_19185 [Pontibacillus yanchengensis]|uniref:Uncharacterized protein n=1 Tax=Pontibacillus yanchengensis TaxID=462910 RepID=A0ACC7VKY3_9BACI|nr:hypothetical protein [Pontibacillus yanchengensis]MYL55442.1 hypothetical protein [Pontibacillus yanchengensis]
MLELDISKWMTGGLLYNYHVFTNAIFVTLLTFIALAVIWFIVVCIIAWLFDFHENFDLIETIYIWPLLFSQFIAVPVGLTLFNNFTFLHWNHFF